MRSGLIDIVMFIIGIGVTATVYFLTSYQNKVAQKRLEAAFGGGENNAVASDNAPKNKKNYFSCFDGLEKRIDKFFDNILVPLILWIGTPIFISVLIQGFMEDKSYFQFICGGMVSFSVLIYLMSRKMFWLILVISAIIISTVCAIFFLIRFALVPGVCCLLLTWIFVNILVAMAGD